MNTIMARILSFLPAALTAVFGVEQILSTAPGTTKKQVVMNVLQTASVVGQQLPPDIQPMVSGMVDGIVQAFNQAGVFSTTKTTSTTQSTPNPPTQ